MNGNFNKLTPDETERLALLIEECGEVIQAATKILRHGYESHNPITGNGPNRVDLQKEIAHVLVAVSLLVLNDDIQPAFVDEEIDAKIARINRYLHHNQVEDEQMP